LRINEISFDRSVTVEEKRQAIDEAVDMYYQMNDYVNAQESEQLPVRPQIDEFDEAAFDRMIEAENVKQEAMLAIKDAKSRGGFVSLVKKRKVWMDKGLHRIPKTKITEGDFERSNYICSVQNLEKYAPPAYISVRSYNKKNDFSTYGEKVKGNLSYTKLNFKEIEKNVKEIDFLIMIQEPGYYKMELYQEF
jgi:hypothetical protein